MTRCSWSWVLSSLFWLRRAVADEITCLANASTDRQQILIDGVSMPIGIIPLQWASAEIVSHILMIITKEVLGLDAIFRPGYQSSSEGVFAIGGCKSGSNCLDDPSLEEPVRRDHVCLETWQYGEKVVDMFERRAHPRKPFWIDGMGYLSAEGAYLNYAVDYEGMSSACPTYLTYYQVYNSTRKDLASYFSSIADIDLRNFTTCSSVRASSSPYLADYAKHFPADTDGVFETPGGGHRANCSHGDRWWFAPACRNDPSTCVPYIDRPEAWGSWSMMQKATEFNMPLAIGFARTPDAWKSLAQSKRVLYYWFTPDNALISLRPKPVRFPAFDPEEFAMGKRTSAVAGTTVGKTIVESLTTITPRLFRVLYHFRLSSKLLDNLLFELEGGNSAWKVACDFIIKFPSLWKEWVPAPTNCYSGQGVVSATGLLLSSRTGATGCTNCPPGRWSVASSVEDPTLRTCEPCGLGRFANAYSSMTCELCLEGFFAKDTLQTACEGCALGTFQSQRGQAKCEDCPSSFSTQVRGANSIQECICMPGYVFNNQSGACAKCTLEGLFCPGGYIYGTGTADVSPLLEAGYMSLPEDPMSVYDCVNPSVNCPCLRSPWGQQLGTFVPQGCERKLTGVCISKVELSPRCSRCTKGYWTKPRSGCTICERNSTFMNSLRVLGAVLLQFLFMVYLYMRFNRPQPPGAIMGASLLSFVQSLAVIARLPIEWPSVLSWLPLLERFISAEGFLTIVDLHIECISTTSFMSRLVLNALAPAFLIWNFALLWAPMKVMGHPLKKPFVLNTVALVFSNFFMVISGMVFSIFISEEMPNGRPMIKAYPEVEYGTDAWFQSMPISVAAGLAYCVSFFTYVIHAILTAPKRAAADPTFAEQYRFMIGIVRADCWWWQLIQLSYGFLCNLIQALSDHLHFTLYATIFIVFIFVLFEVYFQPFKFVINTVVDIVLMFALMLMLIFSTCFIDPRTLDNPKEYWPLFGILVIISMSVAVLFALFSMIRWAFTLCMPAGYQMARVLNHAHICRDVFIAVAVMPEKEFLGRLMTLQDGDIRLLSRCTCMLVATLFKMQPSTQLRKQRVMPNTEFKLWDPRYTELQVLEAAHTGNLQEAVVQNDLMRSNIREFRFRLMNHLGVRRLTERDIAQQSSSRLAHNEMFLSKCFGCSYSLKTKSFRFSCGGLRKELKEITEAKEAAACIWRSRKTKTMALQAATQYIDEALGAGVSLGRQEFISAVQLALGPEGCKGLDLHAIFDGMDIGNKSEVSMPNFVTVLLAEDMAYSNASLPLGHEGFVRVGQINSLHNSVDKHDSVSEARASLAHNLSCKSRNGQEEDLNMEKGSPTSIPFEEPPEDFQESASTLRQLSSASSEPQLVRL